MNKGTYHHGDLRAAILAEAARLVAQHGADRVSMRSLASAAGVSHAAPAHHFTDRRGLFTALATEGFQQLAHALIDARPRFLDAAQAYVRFAIDHPGHFTVMFDSSLHDPDSAELVAAQAAAGDELARGVGTLGDPRVRADPDGAELAAWSLVHGLATLWLNGAIDARAEGPAPTVERIARLLFDELGDG